MQNTVSEKPADCIGRIPRAVRQLLAAVSSLPNCRISSLFLEPVMLIIPKTTRSANALWVWPLPSYPGKTGGWEPGTNMSERGHYRTTQRPLAAIAR